MIIHINGMPGVGKQTVARLLAESLDAHLIDNHLLIDLVTSIHKRGSSDYFSMLEKLTDLVLEEVSRTSNETFILTNALTDELPEDRNRLDRLSQFAENHGLRFIQVLLNCDLEENKRRIASENRLLKGKLVNAQELEFLRQNYTIYHPPSKFALTINATDSSAENISEQIKHYLDNLK